MEKSKRDWGRSSLLDYVPILGVAYRLYWLRLARKGLSISGSDPEENAEGWKKASTREASRLFVSSVFTAGWGTFAVKPQVGLVAVITGVFLHRIAALVLGVET